MRIITRTGYGNALQSAIIQGIPYQLLSLSTLNEALNDPLIVPYPPSTADAGMEFPADYDSATDTVKMKSQYYVIGNMGHRIVTVDTIAVTEPVPHLSTDAGLYHMIPFVVREIYPSNNDLTQGERESYRLRKTMEIDSKLYAAYYAKRIDNSAVSADLLLTTIDNDVVSTSVFSPSISNLRPTQPSIGATSTGSYLSTSSATPIALTADEVGEIISACTLLYGNPSLAIITEIGIVQGVDKTITSRVPVTGAPIHVAVTPNVYWELVGAQITNHICDNYPLGSLNNGFSFTIDVGITEPLFGTVIEG
jgi:hypothetical protein